MLGEDLGDEEIKSCEDVKEAQESQYLKEIYNEFNAFQWISTGKLAISSCQVSASSMRNHVNRNNIGVSGQTDMRIASCGLANICESLCGRNLGNLRPSKHGVSNILSFDMFDRSHELPDAHTSRIISSGTSAVNFILFSLI